MSREESRNANRPQLRDNRYAAGLCVECGKEPHLEGYRTGKVCHVKFRERTRQQRERGKVVGKLEPFNAPIKQPAHSRTPFNQFADFEPVRPVVPKKPTPPVEKNSGGVMPGPTRAEIEARCGGTVMLG